MMQPTKVKDGQTPLDIVLEKCGDITKLFDFADVNDINITDDLTVGSVVEAPVVSNEYIAKVFTPVYLTPVSGITDDDINEGGGGISDDGIGFWEIENDFEVQDNA